jgi:iron complex outermembrane recepter protein
MKGPSSSLFGAGLAGVVLFHPKTATQNFAQNQTTIGSFGTIKDILSAGINEDKLNIFALGSIIKSEGYRENNETNRSNILLNSIWSFSTNANLQVLLKGTKMKAYIPSSLDLPTFQEHPEQAAANWKNIEGYEEYTNGQFGISLNILTDNNHKISAATFGSFRDADELRPFNRFDGKLKLYRMESLRSKNDIIEEITANIYFQPVLNFFAKITTGQPFRIHQLRFTF